MVGILRPCLFWRLQVRLLADLLLGRLGFATLVVHLEPIAACFGNGTTSACVVNIGSSSCSVCCVDDAVVLPPLSSRTLLPYGLVDMAGALTGWMGCYGHWPVQLQQQGIGFNSSGGGAGAAQGAGGEQALPAAEAAADVPVAPAGAAGSSSKGGCVSPGSVYGMLLMEDLVLQQCYFPKVGPHLLLGCCAGRHCCCMACVLQQCAVRHLLRLHLCDL